MSVYNGQDFVSEAVESVLQQSFTDFELLIIDDGSTDSTPDILHSFDAPQIRIVTNSRNLGLTRSLNKGLSRARGEFIARLDADDMAARDRLEKQVSFLNAQPDYAAVGCWCLCRSEGNPDELRRWPVDDTSTRWLLLFRTAIPHPGLTARASAVKAVGGYDESLPYAQDYDLQCRLARIGRLQNLPQALIIYRRHGAQISSTSGKEQTKCQIAISCREMGRLLGTGPIEPRLRACAQSILTRGKLPVASEAHETMTFSLGLARRFEHVNECPGFLSEQLEWLLKEHVKFAALCLLSGRLDEAALRGWTALQLAGSGLIRHPFRLLAKAGIRCILRACTRQAVTPPSLRQNCKDRK